MPDKFIAFGTTRTVYKNLGHDVLYWDGDDFDVISSKFPGAEKSGRKNIVFVPNLDKKWAKIMDESRGQIYDRISAAKK